MNIIVEKKKEKKKKKKKKKEETSQLGKDSLQKNYYVNRFAFLLKKK